MRIWPLLFATAAVPSEGSKPSVCRALKVGPKKLDQAVSRKNLLLSSETDLAMETLFSSKTCLVSEVNKDIRFLKSQFFVDVIRE